MADAQEIDVEQIMEQVRENVRRRREELPSSGPTNPPADGQVSVDLTALHTSYDVYHIPLTSHRWVLGSFVVSVKKILRKLLTPILMRQVAYNAANTRVVTHLRDHVLTVGQQLTALTQQEELREEALTRQAQAVEGIQAQLEALSQQEVQRREDALTRQAQTLRTEMAAHVEGLRQQQAAALQALQAEVAGQAQGFEHKLEREMTARAAQLVGLEERVQRVGDNLTLLERTQGEHFSRLEGTLAERETSRDTRMLGLERTLLHLKTNLILQERRITLLLEEARKRLPQPFTPEQLQMIADEGQHALDALYVSFEDQFRGTREEIKERFRVYLPILKEAKLGTATMPIVDVGCGRGEWLELLQAEGLQALGVDLNRVLVGECRQYGLEIIESEVIAYLRSLPDGSLGAVTGFHIIEHFPFELVIKLLDETVRVLKPGGLAIFETPNPQNVLVGSHHFYLDPTHRNPLPSLVMKFMAEARGLCRVEIMHLHPFPEAAKVPEDGLDITTRFNEYFYGPQDYAVLGWKA